MSPILKNSVHEMSPFENVHEKSPILKNSVHEMSLSTKCLHPIFCTDTSRSGCTAWYICLVVPVASVVAINVQRLYVEFSNWQTN